MGDIVNLRQARKRRRRAENERTAEANRLQHGRTKGEKLEEADLEVDDLAFRRRRATSG